VAKTTILVKQYQWFSGLTVEVGDPQRIEVGGAFYNRFPDFNYMEAGTIQWGASKSTNVLILYIDGEGLLITINGDPIVAGTTKELRAFKNSITATFEITAGPLAENQSFSYAGFAGVRTTENDTITGSNGNDEFNRGIGDDEITAANGDDLIDAGKGNDTIFGGDGQDLLYGGLGNDLIFGGNAGAGVDEIYGGGGRDKIHDGGTGAHLILGDGGNDKLFLETGFGELYSGGGSDRLVIKSTALDINGFEQNPGAHGGGGNDRIIGGDAREFLRGDAGKDTIWGNDGADGIRGGSGDDTLYGGANGDEIEGEDGNDKLYGGGADDIMIGGQGGDLLAGGNGSDTAFYITAVTANLANSTKNTGEAAGDIYDSIENLSGGNFSDALTGNGGRNVLNGYNGDDTLFGGGGKDYLEGGEGINSLYGGKGNDFLSTIEGGFSGESNFIFGGSGADNVNSGSGDDTIFGGGGRDDIFSGDGRDVIKAGGGNDVISSGGGKDTIFGGAGADSFSFFKAQNDKVTIMDFQDNTDVLMLDDSLFRNKAGDFVFTAAQVVAKFAVDVDGGALFDLGNGNQLFLEGITSSALVDDILG
jgi:Ca2+-binding RTX toxin-like protein